MAENELNEEYLGDGLYASFDGWHFMLRAPRTAQQQQRSPRPMEDHVVYLEIGRGGTFVAFQDYATRMLRWVQEEQTKAEKAEARKRDAAEGFE